MAFLGQICQKSSQKLILLTFVNDLSKIVFSPNYALVIIVYAFLIDFTQESLLTNVKHAQFFVYL